MNSIRLNTGSLPYRPNARKLIQLFSVGLFATAFAMLFTFLLTSIGAPAPDFGQIYGAAFQSLGFHNVEESVALGWVIHWTVGIFLIPLLFDYLVDRDILTNAHWWKGHAFALVLWFGVEGILKPLANQGFFSAKTLAPVSAVFASFFVVLAYSLTLEMLMRLPIAHQIYRSVLSDNREAA